MLPKVGTKTTLLMTARLRGKRPVLQLRNALHEKLFAFAYTLIFQVICI